MGTVPDVERRASCAAAASPAPPCVSGRARESDERHVWKAERAGCPVRWRLRLSHGTSEVRNRAPATQRGGSARRCGGNGSPTPGEPER